MSVFRSAYRHSVLPGRNLAYTSGLRRELSHCKLFLLILVNILMQNVSILRQIIHIHKYLSRAKLSFDRRENFMQLQRQFGQCQAYFRLRCDLCFVGRGVKVYAHSRSVNAVNQMQRRQRSMTMHACDTQQIATLPRMQLDFHAV